MEKTLENTFKRWLKEDNVKQNERGQIIGGRKVEYDNTDARHSFKKKGVVVGIKHPAEKADKD